MIIYTSYIWVLTALFGFVSCYVGSQINLSCENGVCSRQADQGPCVVSDDHERLFRWDPVKVNRNDLSEWQCKKCRFYVLTVNAYGIQGLSSSKLSI